MKSSNLDLDVKSATSILKICKNAKRLEKNVIVNTEKHVAND